MFLNFNISLTLLCEKQLYICTQQTNKNYETKIYRLPTGINNDAFNSNSVFINTKQFLK